MGMTWSDLPGARDAKGERDKKLPSHFSSPLTSGTAQGGYSVDPAHVSNF